jgi:hypothetical protein
MVLFGGANSGGSLLSDTWVFTGSAWQSMDTTSTPSAREWMIPLDFNPEENPVGTQIFYGGQAGQVLNDSWSWSDMTGCGPFPIFTPPPLLDGLLIWFFGSFFVLVSIFVIRPRHPRPARIPPGQ